MAQAGSLVPLPGNDVFDLHTYLWRFPIADLVAERIRGGDEFTDVRRLLLPLYRSNILHLLQPRRVHLHRAPDHISRQAHRCVHTDQADVYRNLVHHSVIAGHDFIIHDEASQQNADVDREQ